MTGPKKIVFLAKLLPVVGLLLLLPPLVSIGSPNTQLFGIPSIVTYLFAVWLFLIIGSYLLQLKLASHIPDQSEQNQTPPASKTQRNKNHD